MSCGQTEQPVAREVEVTRRRSRPDRLSRGTAAAARCADDRAPNDLLAYDLVEILGRRCPMPAYSQDLRQRVIDAVERKEGSIRQIARRFVVSLSFVVRLLQLKRRTGSVEPKPHGGGR